MRVNTSSSQRNRINVPLIVIHTLLIHSLHTNRNEQYWKCFLNIAERMIFLQIHFLAYKYFLKTLSNRLLFHIQMAVWIASWMCLWWSSLLGNECMSHAINLRNHGSELPGRSLGGWSCEIDGEWRGETDFKVQWEKWSETFIGKMWKQNWSISFIDLIRDYNWECFGANPWSQRCKEVHWSCDALSWNRDKENERMFECPFEVNLLGPICMDLNV